MGIRRTSPTFDVVADRRRCHFETARPQAFRSAHRVRARDGRCDTDRSRRDAARPHRTHVGFARCTRGTSTAWDRSRDSSEVFGVEQIKIATRWSIDGCLPEPMGIKGNCLVRKSTAVTAVHATDHGQGTGTYGHRFRAERTRQTIVVGTLTVLTICHLVGRAL